MKFAVAVCLSLLIVGCNPSPKSGDPESDSDVSSVTQEIPCSSNVDVSNDGWGWENGQTCRSAEAIANTVVKPECTSAAENQGDGWGWEDGESCRWRDAAAALASVPECTNTAINHGNGWGWDNGSSCLWGDSTLSGNSITVGVQSDSGQCSPSALDTGDGWGWEYGAACEWGSLQPNSSIGAVNVARPGWVGAPGYVNGLPICLTDASDGNHDGFGFENNRTCTVVEGTTATAQKPLLNTRWCQPWAEISYGDYVLQNNTWNDSEVYEDYWHQCIELTGNESRYIAKWDYNWLDKTRGNEFSVKSYPQVYYGRKTSNSISGTPEELGLPEKINRLPKFKVKYKYSETGNAERNVALESFFHTSCDAEEWNKQFEMMVWVGVPVIRVAGPLVAEVTIDGVGWNVHTNPSLGWGYVAFVAQQPVQEGWLDWNKFVDWTRFSGPAFGVPRVQENTCMGAIEIGTETFWGQGTFTLNEFEVFKQ